MSDALNFIVEVVIFSTFYREPNGGTQREGDRKLTDARVGVDNELLALRVRSQNGIALAVTVRHRAITKRVEELRDDETQPHSDYINI